MDTRNEDEMGQLAYDTYKESVGGKAVNGDELPEYRNLPMHVLVGWIAAARAVATAVRSERHG